jgi:DUF917 family protein
MTDVRMHLTGSRLSSVRSSDIEDIARGAAVLGAGGGGDPYLGSLIAQHALQTRGSVELVDPQDVPDDALVLPVAIMGAPTVIVERPPAGDELQRAVTAMSKHLGRSITHIAFFEAGGLNSMTPIQAAAETGLPLIDGDGMGRAFPELQMVSFALDGVTASPMVLADDKGNTVLLDTVDNMSAERLARVATVEMGCSAPIALYAHSGAETKRAQIPNTLTLTRDIGKLIRDARVEHRDAATALTEAIGGRVLQRGKVRDVSRTTTGGFVRGTAVIDGLSDDMSATLELDFQNENLVARRNGQLVATVPDLICVLDADTGDPITTEALRYGFRVSVVALPCDPRWRTEAGLELVGPRYFGYDVDYAPIA